MKILENLLKSETRGLIYNSKIIYTPCLILEDTFRLRTDGKAEVGRVREEKGIRKKSQKRRSQQRKIQAHEKVEKSGNETLCFSNVLWRMVKK
jgi:hypothetical protein